MKNNIILFFAILFLACNAIVQAENDTYSITGHTLFAQTTQTQEVDTVFQIYKEENKKSNHYRHELGISASFFSGYGISYQYNFDPYNSLKVVFFGYSTESDNSQTNTNFIGGLEYKRNFHISRAVKVYGFVGGFINYYEYNYNYYYDYYSSDNRIENSYNIGTGIGTEFTANRFVFSFDIGFRYYYSVERYNNYYDNNRYKYKAFNIGVGAGVAYLF